MIMPEILTEFGAKVTCFVKNHARVTDDTAT
ncbi:uncharacterized protein METZ01_LOCUS261504 [marine metagenome]|uniref:Uncharacterized protein n=1 Tax=marine metagenome TaxID=408172 RepID=A0A382J985_9ZZZZ